MKLLVLSVLLAMGCHERAHEAAAQRPDEDQPARSQVVSPAPALAPPSAASPRESESDIIDSPDESDIASRVFGDLRQRCDGPVYLRVRNATRLDFDSVQLDGVEFGGVRAGAVGKYKRVQSGRCIYSDGALSVRSRAQHFRLSPIDFAGTALQAGHYTAKLTTEPSPDPQSPGGVSHEISKNLTSRNLTSRNPERK